MIRGLQTSFLGLQATQRRVDVTAHNIANASTTGFRRQSVSLQEGHPAAASADAGGLYPGVTVVGPFTDFAPGAVVSTGGALDFAIRGEGFFAVQQGDETLYTRNGAFRLDAEGYLAVPSGARILGEAGPIQSESRDIKILADGTVKVSGQIVDKISIVTFSDNNELARVSDDLYRAGAGTEPQSAERSVLIPGALEAPNVDLATEFVELIQASRAYSANLKAVQAEDELSDRVINQVGVLR
ncbi:MAG: flagellar hook basal-body protein [Bacillota bacterium]|uniref:flagellar hook-basal body protein n=1 Tax=Desulforudis sp. DRI-14 TaxID=3459793 RepID=UPI0034949E81